MQYGQNFRAILFPTNVYVVDVHGAFLGRHDLLLGERPGVSPFETHAKNKAIGSWRKPSPRSSIRNDRSRGLLVSCLLIPRQGRS
jgi:hypothetical protein